MTKITYYRNPWHKPGRPEYGPAVYSTGVAPKEYRGHLIYHRQTNVWDVVKDGVCVTQCAGLGGAQRAVDAMLAQMEMVSEREIEAAREAWREYWCEEDVHRNRNTRDGITAALEAAARVRAEANAEAADARSGAVNWHRSDSAGSVPLYTRPSHGGGNVG